MPATAQMQNAVSEWRGLSNKFDVGLRIPQNQQKPAPPSASLGDECTRKNTAESC